MNKKILLFSTLAFVIGMLIGYIATASPGPAKPNPGHSWSEIGDFPSDCPSGQYVYGLGTTLKCSTPAPSGILQQYVSAQGSGFASTDWSDLISLSINPSTNSILQIFFYGTAIHQCPQSTAWAHYRIVVDGTQIGSEVLVRPADLTDPSLQYYVPVSISIAKEVSAGSHTIKVQHKASVDNCWFISGYGPAQLTVFSFVK
jgi:hypothetical protein